MIVYNIYSVVHLATGPWIDRKTIDRSTEFLKFFLFHYAVVFSELKWHWMKWISVVKMSPHVLVLAPGDTVEDFLELAGSPHESRGTRLVVLLSGAYLFWASYRPRFCIWSRNSKIVFFLPYREIVTKGMHFFKFCYIQTTLAIH